MFSDRKLRYQHGRGPCNIFILDTSSFLGKEGFIQMRTTFSTIIDGNFNCQYKINTTQSHFTFGNKTVIFLFKMTF